MSVGTNGSNGHHVESLIKKAVAGDGKAYARLYELYMEPLYRYILLKVHDERLAETITEETFVEAWNILPNYRHRSPHSFAIWLYRVARDLIVDVQYEGRQFEIPDDALGPEPAALHSNGSGNGHLPHEAAQPPAQLLAALAKLNDLEQDIVILAFVEGLPVSVVAAVIHRSQRACRRLQKQALAKLIRQFDFQRYDDQEL